MYNPEELTKLAARLSVAADVSESKAKAHMEAGEQDLAERELNRAESGRHYVSVCNYFAKRLKERERNKGSANRPTLDEALTYVAEHESCKGWPESDVRGWFDHFESNGWLISGKTPMKDWRAALRNGARNYFKTKGKPYGSEPSKALVAATEKQPDPMGWASFVQTALNQPYVAFQYAPGWMKKAYKEAL